MTHPSYGVDYGVRSFHLAFVDGDDHWVSTYTCPKALTRGQELQYMRLAIKGLIEEHGDEPLAPCYIEEPVVAGVRNLRTAIMLAQTAGALATGVMNPRFVPVSTWKKGTVGRGNADKIGVSEWLSDLHPCYFDNCGADQNRVDATCIAIYGANLGSRGDGDQAG